MNAIIQQFEVGPMANFAYIFGCASTRQVVIIDPTAEVPRLLHAVEELGATLVAVINTHGHADHIAGNAAVLAARPVPLIVHASCELHGDGMMSRQIFAMLEGGPSPEPTRRVQHGDKIAVGELELEVVHAPGHTPGDMLLYHRGAVFTGDVLFVGGLGRTDLPGSSMQQMARSLRERVATLPDDTVVYPGHNYGPRPTSTIGQEKRFNPYVAEVLQ
ncbi:MAG: MBL fold metallo-hydrolase [Pseudomonadota bacterium]